VNQLSFFCGLVSVGREGVTFGGFFFLVVVLFFVTTFFFDDIFLAIIQSFYNIVLRVCIIIDQ